MSGRRGARFWGVLAVVALLLALCAAALVWRDDVLEALLNPKIPYSVYKPPRAPDYAEASAWALLGEGSDRATSDVFFVHPTTFDGGKNWNGPINDTRSARLLARVMAPNYAAPFATGARVFIPRYRQASLYTSLSLFDDAIDARRFAYGDIRDALNFYLEKLNQGRPFVLVGVEQGGSLTARLLREVIAPNPGLRTLLVGAYLIDTVVPADEFAAGAAVPSCSARDEAGCVLAWMSVQRGDFGRAQRVLSRSLVWNAGGELVSLAGREPLCVNPLLGARTDAAASERFNLGAANATGLEWGLRPGFMARQVAARCENGVLSVSEPRSASLKPSGDWADRLKEPGYNLFYADLEADVHAREAQWQLDHATPRRKATPPR